jgi:hypothetical protein
MPEGPRTLYVVRVKEEVRYWLGRPLQSKVPFGMEGIFVTRHEAEAIRDELEKKAGQLGDPRPLLDIAPTLDELMALSAFEPGVFRDWLLDHDIPEPHETDLKHSDAPTPLYDWLYSLSSPQMADLYQALHHFHFYTIGEVPFVEGAYEREQWEAWEKELPEDAVFGPGDEGFEEIEGGFQATSNGFPPASLFGDLPEEDVTPEGQPPAPPWTPPLPSVGSDDEIPF